MPIYTIAIIYLFLIISFISSQDNVLSGLGRNPFKSLRDLLTGSI